ncbi:sugar transferase [Actinacidiphila yeochonensis]|uniref:sugar transferase n=1 Tax=Actinacidiphila yeochonensis TaxID=89050 RepID=UPI00389913F1
MDNAFTPYSASAAHGRLVQPPFAPSGPFASSGPSGPFASSGPLASSASTGPRPEAAPPRVLAGGAPGTHPLAEGGASPPAAPGTGPVPGAAPAPAGSTPPARVPGADGRVAVLPQVQPEARLDRTEPRPDQKESRPAVPPPGGAARTATEAESGTEFRAESRAPSGAESGPAAAGPTAAGTAARGRRQGRPSGWAAALAAADGAAALLGLALVGPHGGPVLPVVLLAVLYAAQRRTGLYRPLLAPATLDEVPSAALGTALAWGLAAAALAATAPRRALDWSDLFGAAALTLLGCVALRGLVHRLHRWRRGRRPEPALVVGDAPAARHVAEALRAHPEYGLYPVTVSTDPADPHTPADPADLTDPSGLTDLVRRAAREDVRHVLLVGPHPAHPADGPSPAAPGRRTGAGARDAVGTAVAARLAGLGCRTWRVEPAGRAGEPGGSGAHHLWAYACSPVETARARGKRATDVLLAGTALLAVSPVLAGCALAVRLADGPGVLFRQERIGRGGRPFTLLKFRTLRPRDEDEAATRWSIAHDGRVSGVGRLLRRTSLDELPQLWNVLRGDMSLVGPRPERPHFVEEFSRTHAGYADRHRMPAGLTGLAQVHGLRGDTSIADRARFDNHYIDSWSLWRDVAIMLRTALALLRPGGS